VFAMHALNGGAHLVQHRGRRAHVHQNLCGGGWVGQRKGQAGEQPVGSGGGGWLGAGGGREAAHAPTPARTFRTSPRAPLCEMFMKGTMRSFSLGYHTWGGGQGGGAARWSQERTAGAGAAQPPGPAGTGSVRFPWPAPPPLRPLTLCPHGLASTVKERWISSTVCWSPSSTMASPTSYGCTTNRNTTFSSGGGGGGGWRGGKVEGMQMKQAWPGQHGSTAKPQRHAPLRPLPTGGADGVAEDEGEACGAAGPGARRVSLHGVSRRGAPQRHAGAAVSRAPRPPCPCAVSAVRRPLLPVLRAHPGRGMRSLPRP
jgi:hypothetical protein